MGLLKGEDLEKTQNLKKGKNGPNTRILRRNSHRLFLERIDGNVRTNGHGKEPEVQISGGCPKKPNRKTPTGKESNQRPKKPNCQNSAYGLFQEIVAVRHGLSRIISKPIEEGPSKPTLEPLGLKKPRKPQGLTKNPPPNPYR